MSNPATEARKKISEMQSKKNALLEGSAFFSSDPKVKLRRLPEPSRGRTDGTACG